MSSYFDGGETDVIIIGGGATGAGIARDCARRGALHLAGAPRHRHRRHRPQPRFTAQRRALCGDRRRVGARVHRREPHPETHCPPLHRAHRWAVHHPAAGLAGLSATVYRRLSPADIDAEAIDPQLALRTEPAASPALIGAVRVPDGTVDPFRLTAANMLDAREHGAQILTYHRWWGCCAAATG